MTADNALRIRTLTGAGMAEGLQAFHDLTATVFGEWPYLYQPRPGSRSYLTHLLSHPRAALFLALAGDTPVGAATCRPLHEEPEHVQAPFRARGWDPRRFFYFGEGLVAREWRGKGLGVRFFALRESHARAVSLADYAVFCSVRRPVDHPLRPTNPSTNDAFWRNRGYQPLAGVACTMRWRDRGEADESEHLLDFWIKSLNGAALP